jgi:hypothetical protein
VFDDIGRIVGRGHREDILDRSDQPIVEPADPSAHLDAV